MQLEILKYSSQLNEGFELKKVLNKIDFKKNHEKVETGSLVYTTNGNFFIAISAGKITIEQKEYVTISYSSPLTQALYGKKVNDKIHFRDKVYLIESIS